jgi:hypothetical protein
MVRLAVILVFFVISNHAVAFADGNSITSFEISVTREFTSICINAPPEFSFNNDRSQGIFEFIFPDCSVNLLGSQTAYVPSISPLFKNVEISRLPGTSSSVLRIKLAEDQVNPWISVRPSENWLIFEFKNPPQAVLTADDSRSEIQKSEDIQVGKKWEFPVKNEIDPVVQIPVSHKVDQSTPESTPSDLEPVKQVETESGQETEFTESEKIENESDVLTANEISPIDLLPQSEISEPAEKQSLPVLLAITYSEGRSDRDVLTFEFESSSPGFDHYVNDNGEVILNFYSLITPGEILPGDFIRKEVKGTVIRMIALSRGKDTDNPSLEIVLSASGMIDYQVEDLNGLIEVSLIRGGN